MKSPSQQFNREAGRAAYKDRLITSLAVASVILGTCESDETQATFNLQSVVAQYADLGINTDSHTLREFITDGELTTSLHEDVTSRITEIPIDSAPEKSTYELDFTVSNPIGPITTKWQSNDGPWLRYGLNHPIIKIEQSEDTDHVRVTDLRPPDKRSIDTTSYETLTGLVVKEIDALAAIGMGRGAIRSVEFLYNPDAHDSAAGYYYGDIDTASIVIHPRSTPEELIRVARHEIAHSIFAKSELSQLDEHDAYRHPQSATIREACAQLRTDALQSTANSTALMSAEVAELASREQSTTITNALHILAETMSAGTLDTLQDTSDVRLHDASTGNILGDIAECRTHDLPDTLSYILKTRLQTQPSPMNPTTYRPSDEVINLDDTYRSTLRQAPQFKYLSEHGYIEGDPDIGHVEDGIDELAASLFVIASAYPDRLKDNIATLNETSRQAVYDAYDVIRSELVRIAPELQPHLPKSLHK